MNSDAAHAPATMSDGTSSSTCSASPSGSPGNEVTARVRRRTALDLRRRRNRRRRRSPAARRGEETAGIARGAVAGARQHRGVALTIRKGCRFDGLAAAPPAPWPPLSRSTRCSARAPRRAPPHLRVRRRAEWARAPRTATTLRPVCHGGFVLVRRAESARHRSAPVPDGLVAVVVHPGAGNQNGARAGDPRRPLRSRTQFSSAQTRGFVNALHRSISRCSRDRLRNGSRTEACSARARVRRHQGAAMSTRARSDAVCPDRDPRCARSAAATGWRRLVAAAMTTAVMGAVGDRSANLRVAERRRRRACRSRFRADRPTVES